MGYLYLSLALLCGLIKAYCGKRSSHTASTTYDAVCINTLRMLLCILIGLILVLFDGAFAGVTLTPKLLLISLLCGASTAGFVVSWLLAVHSLSYMLVEVFIMGGVLFPLLFSALCYGEAVGAWQAVGILLLLFAVYCMCSNKRGEPSARLSPKGFLLLFACAAFSGFSDFSQKLYVNECVGATVSFFNLCTYVFAALTLAAALFFFRRAEKRNGELPTVKSIVLPILPYIVIMAICLFLNSYFKTLSASYLDAVILYPLSQGMSVALALLMSAVLFKEKVNAKMLFGVALAVFSMILINLA